MIKLKAFIALGITALVLAVASSSPVIACIDKGSGCMLATSVTDMVSALEMAVWVFVAGCLWRCLRGVLRVNEPEPDDAPYS
jgi:hypothetical protein